MIGTKWSNGKTMDLESCVFILDMSTMYIN